MGESPAALSSKKSRRATRRHGARQGTNGSLNRPEDTPDERKRPIPLLSCAPDAEFVTLPDPQVLTLDGEMPEEGTKLYIQYSLSSLSEYEVLSDIAIRDPRTREWQLIVLGPKLPVISRPARLFVVDSERWVEFWKKRHPNFELEIEDAD